MKKQYIGMIFSVSLVSQPAMAAHLSVMSWKGAETADTEWNDRIYKPDDKGKKNIPKLSRAVLQGNGEKVLQMLIIDKDANEADDYGVTPLHFAALKGHNQILDILLENGAKIDARDKYGRTPLMYAVLKGHQTTIERLLQHKPDLNIADNLGRTALHWAVSKAKFNITDALIDAGADVRMQDNEGNTALHYAASIRYMFGAEKNLNSAAVNAGFTAAGFASAGVLMSAFTITAILLQGTAVGTILGSIGSSTAFTGPALLVIAVIVALVFASIEISAAIEKDSDQERRHKIHGQRNKIIKRLLEKNNALVSIANKEGRIPSHFAALAGNQEPQELINAAAKKSAPTLWSTADKNGLTPLMCAMMGGHENNDLTTIGLADPLVSRGFADSANSAAAGMQVIDKKGRPVKFVNESHITPLKFAFMFNENKKFGDILKEVGADDIFADAQGRTILHYAAMAGNNINKIYDIYGNISWQKIVMENNAIKYVPTTESMVTAQDRCGATPIHYAAMTTVDGLKFLLNKVEKLDLAQMTDKNGMTPLHYAAMSGKEEAVELLLNKVAKDQREEFANIKAATVDTYGNQLSADIAGKTARDLAQQAGHVNLVAYLSKKMGEKKSDDKKAFAERQQETRVIQKEKARAGKTQVIQDKKDKILERKTENIEKKAEQKRWDEDKKADKLENKTKMKKINKNLSAGQQPAFIDAAQSGKPEVVEAMIRQGTDLLVVDAEGRTALMYAAENGYARIVDVILAAANKQGIDKTLVDMKDKYGKTARDFAGNHNNIANKIAAVMVR